MSADQTAAESYEPPTVTVMGSLWEKTEQHGHHRHHNKFFSTSSDFHYPHGYSFNFS